MTSEIPTEIPDELENLCKKVGSTLSASIKSVHDSWSEIYGAQDSLNSIRLNKLEAKITNFCRDLQKDAEEQKNKLIKRIEDARKEIVELEKLLDRQGFKETHNTNSEVPLIQLVSELESVLSKYRAEKTERLDKLLTLQREEETLCNFLNLPVPPAVQLINSSIPTINELQEIENIICDHEVQKQAVMGEFYVCRKAVASLIKELGIVPVFEHEIAACKENDSLFPPNKKNLEELKIFKQQLISRLNSIKLEAHELRDKLKEMWQRCKWNESDLNIILNRHNGYSEVDISELKKELNKCEEERRTHAKEFIMDIRDQISRYWDMMYFSEEDKKKFKHFSTTDCNEDVLTIHEVEFENLKIHYDKYKNIYKLIEKRREYWDRLKSMEEAAKDPDRLFRNRGGQLLKEEKERKLIQKELPRLEDLLLRCISEYEQETRTSFCYYGHNMKDLIKAEWENWQTDKDSEKHAKRIANPQEVESKPRTPNAAGIKRKMPVTPKQVNVSNKIFKICGPKSQTVLLKTSRSVLDSQKVQHTKDF